MAGSNYSPSTLPQLEGGLQLYLTTQFANISKALKAMQPASATFALTPPAAAQLEGSIRTITDSTVNTWGATIAGGGSYRVLAQCNGTNWTVIGI